MYNYLFTNDLRINSLDSSIKDAAEKIINNTVPPASEAKSENNNIKTLSFYFNLLEDSKCAQYAAQGDIRKVVLNFIKKFQFPNPRTFDSYSHSNRDAIKLAPMRLILKLLYLILINEGEEGYLSIEEIENFIFYNSKATESFNPNLISIYSMIRKYRRSGEFPDYIETNQDNRQWNHGERQLREMIKILNWSGCVDTTNSEKIKINHVNLSNQNKIDIFDIINYSNFWEGKYPFEHDDRKEIQESYRKYMDISEDEASIGEEAQLRSGVLESGKNLLIYGVPGCGKSYYIKERYQFTDDNSERVVFHPDYTYSDFIGQILPKIKIIDPEDNSKTTIEYSFVPGPFTRLLKRCMEDSETMHYLVIEEINRGNAPAIFGEIFQLLDRGANGKSEYGITNFDIAKELYNDENKKVKIPANLTILATMNTADQNVFTLDTAFKRRWEMLSIRNDFKIKDNDTTFNAQLQCKLCNTELTWQIFATTINNIILDDNSNLANEDKRLGHFFVAKNEMHDVKKFSEKVIMYLWNDVFKFEKDKIFNSAYRTLEQVLDAFKDPRIRFKIFDDKLSLTHFTDEISDLVDDFDNEVDDDFDNEINGNAHEHSSEYPQENPIDE